MRADNGTMLPETRTLVERLARRLHAEVVETHVSWVLLAGDRAYKLKKPLRLPFLDYSTPEQRAQCCAEEVRLNRRLAPGIYLGVSLVNGPARAPGFDGRGETLDYAVRMLRFPPGALFSEQLAAGTLTSAMVDRLAERLAAFHAEVPACTEPEPEGRSLSRRALAALEGSLPLLAPGEQAGLRAWIAAQAPAADALWARRRAAGHAREGHGDLHLDNLLALQEDVAAFDCIEFDPALRCIDGVEDVAFTLMDFAARGAPELGWRFLDGWLERSGEYEGLPGLRLCLVYRALVRAQVEWLRAPRGAAAARYAREALRWSAPARPQLFITHGLPGSGKSFASQQLLQRVGAIRIRSDVERKRLFGLEPLAASAGRGLALYTPEATRRTYARLFALATELLEAGLPVVLDAAFLRREERRSAQAVAQRAGVPFSILACAAPEEVLRKRLQARRLDPSEADVAVLDRLRGVAEPLAADELACVAAD
jgi:hypothetical protein